MGPKKRVKKTGKKNGSKNGSKKQVKKGSIKRVKKGSKKRVKKTGSKNGSKKHICYFSSYFLGSSPFHSNNDPKSLPAGQQIPESNGPMSLHNNNTNWNPFEDMKNFAEMIKMYFSYLQKDSS